MADTLVIDARFQRPTGSSTTSVTLQREKKSIDFIQCQRIWNWESSEKPDLFALASIPDGFGIVKALSIAVAVINDVAPNDTRFAMEPVAVET